jgi:hypothetical protein
MDQIETETELLGKKLQKKAAVAEQSIEEIE